MLYFDNALTANKIDIPLAKISFDILSFIFLLLLCGIYNQMLII